MRGKSKRGRSKKEMFYSNYSKCLFCGFTMSTSKLEQHWLKEHHMEPGAARAETERLRQVARAEEEEMRRHPAPKLFLESRHGIRSTEARQCDECGVRKNLLWRYRKSNKGIVYICNTCKPIVFDRSFGSVDAFDSVVSGGFE